MTLLSLKTILGFAEECIHNYFRQQILSFFPGSLDPLPYYFEERGNKAKQTQCDAVINLHINFKLNPT